MICFGVFVKMFASFYLSQNKIYRLDDELVNNQKLLGN